MLDWSFGLSSILDGLDSLACLDSDYLVLFDSFYLGSDCLAKGLTFESAFFFSSFLVFFVPDPPIFITPFLAGFSSGFSFGSSDLVSGFLSFS